jgi:hypothetical protein
MKAHRHGDEREEDEGDLPAPGSRSYGMVRQCPRCRTSCKSREDAGVTPMKSTNNATPWERRHRRCRSNTHARSVYGV